MAQKEKAAAATTASNEKGQSKFTENSFDYKHFTGERTFEEEEQDAPGAKDLFSIKPANVWLEEAKKLPIPQELIKHLWYKGEVCILFADSNVGKSIFAVQQAVKIAEDHKLIYFDFELTQKQFETRYSEDYKNHYQFPANFLRAEINPDCDFEGFADFEDYLIASIENEVIKLGIDILIVDNITYLRNETDKSKNALPLMKKLKALKNKYDLSILVLAHTPKRDLTKQITQNDLGGSKMLMNFCDSAFAIGASQLSPSTRYIKQIKQRNSALIYGTDNVLVYEITKQTNFLFMMFKCLGNEHEHLKVQTEKDKQDIVREVKRLADLGKSQRDIAYQLGISIGTVNNYLHK